MPVGEVALALGCLLGRCLEGLDVLEGLDGFGGCLEGLEGFGSLGGLEGLEGFGAFGEFWSVWGLANGQALKANNRKPLLWPWPRALALGCLFEKWPWPWGACGGRCLEGLEGVWRV